MKIGSWTKLITLLVVDIGVILLALFGVLNEQGVIAVLSASLGYVFGNSHGVIEQKIQDK